MEAGGVGRNTVDPPVWVLLVPVSRNLLSPRALFHPFKVSRSRDGGDGCVFSRRGQQLPKPLDKNPGCGDRCTVLEDHRQPPCTCTCRARGDGGMGQVPSTTVLLVP